MSYLLSFHITEVYLDSEGVVLDLSPRPVREPDFPHQVTATSPKFADKKIYISFHVSLFLKISSIVS